MAKIVRIINICSSFNQLFMKNHLFTLFIFTLLPILSHSQNADSIPPVIVCNAQVNVSIAPNGTAPLDYFIFTQSVSDNESLEGQIDLAMRRAGAGTGFPVYANDHPIESITFTCADLGVTLLEIWARDQTGNTSYCYSTMNMIDLVNACQAQLTTVVTDYCTGEGVEDALVNVAGTQYDGSTFEFTSTTNATGAAVSEAFPFGSTSELLVAPFIEFDPLSSGSTTLDLVRLSNHLSGADPFTEPWQWLAADVNMDNQVNANDSVLIRHVMLGVQPGFSVGRRFWPRDYVFVNPANPLSPPPPGIVVTQTPDIPDTVRFLSVRLGDLTGFSCAQSGLTQATNALTANVSPNPTHSGFTITGDNYAAAELWINVYDAAGRLVFSRLNNEPAGAFLIDIPAAALPSNGLYFWSITDAAGRSASGKVLKTAHR